MQTIKLREDFRSFHKIFASYSSKNLIYKFIRKNASQKFGIVIRKKIGNAVQRNLIKRRLRNIIKLTTTSHNVKCGLHLIICREGINNIDFQSLTKEIHKILNY